MNSWSVKICLVILFQYAQGRWYEECGVSKYPDAGTWPPPDGDTEKMIVGGEAVRPNEFPWQASMRSSPGQDGNSQYCGGTLIHPRWVVTAAHCAVGELPEDVTIALGEHDHSTPDSTNPSRVRHAVMEIFLHEEYGGSSENYNLDVALLLLEEEVTFNEDVQPACQPRSIDYVNATAQISGWGTVEWGTSQFPDILQWTEVIVTTNELCDSLLNEINPSFNVNENMICAGDETFFERDTCQGDSGGPMTLMNDEDGTSRFELIGITSWGYQCAGGTPGVYTRVSAVNDWITAKIEKNTPAKK